MQPSVVIFHETTPKKCGTQVDGHRERDILSKLVMTTRHMMQWQAGFFCEKLPWPVKRVNKGRFVLFFFTKHEEQEGIVATILWGRGSAGGSWKKCDHVRTFPLLVGDTRKKQISNTSNTSIDSSSSYTQARDIFENNRNGRVSSD